MDELDPLTHLHNQMEASAASLKRDRHGNRAIHGRFGTVVAGTAKYVLEFDSLYDDVPRVRADMLKRWTRLRRAGFRPTVNHGHKGTILFGAVSNSEAWLIRDVLGVRRRPGGHL